MFDFNDIWGNEALCENLKSAVAHNRVNHAYIFDGDSGSGKMTIAKAFAKTLNCQEGGSTPCNRCKSCIGFDSDNNPDIIYIREEDGKDIKVDTVREKINKEIYIKPYSYKYKIFIIEHGDTMNIQAQNAFLKTLEEPPEYAVFLITSRNYNKFLVTILSRCILFRMKPLPPDMIKKYILENTAVGNNQAEILAHYGQGSIGRAMELSNSQVFCDLLEKAFEIAGTMYSLDLIGMYKMTDGLKEYSANIDSLLELMYIIFRDCLVLKTTGSYNNVIQKNRIKELESIAVLGERQLMKCCEAVNFARNRLKAKGDFQFTVEELLFNMKEKEK